MVAPMIGSCGKCAPASSASKRLVAPAARPLTAAIQVASLSETLRVRLLSRPQARQAPNTASVGQSCSGLVRSGQLRTTAPTTMASMPTAMRLSTFYLNANQASKAVNTPSALSSRDADADGMPVSPTISNTGASTPPQAMAPANHNRSARASVTPGARLRRRYRLRPRPEPRYSRAAIIQGELFLSSRLATGVAAPNSRAASNAAWVPDKVMFFIGFMMRSTEWEAGIGYCKPARSTVRLVVRSKRFAAGLVEQGGQSACRAVHRKRTMRHARYFHQLMAWRQPAFLRGGGDIAEIGVAARIAGRTLALVAAGLAQRIRVRIVVGGAEQVDDVALQVGLFQYLGRKWLLQVSRQLGGKAVVPVAEAGATGAGAGKRAVRLRAPVVEVQIRCRIGGDVAHMDAGGAEGLAAASDHGITLDELAAGRMAGEHDLAQLGKAGAVGQLREDGVDHREGADRRRRFGVVTLQPTARLPAQGGGRQVVRLDIDGGEELRGDEQGVGGERADPLLQVAVGVDVASRPAVDDDDGARDIGLRKVPIARDAQRDVAGTGTGLHREAAVQHHRHGTVDDVDLGSVAQVDGDKTQQGAQEQWTDGVHWFPWSRCSGPVRGECIVAFLPSPMLTAD